MHRCYYYDINKHNHIKITRIQSQWLEKATCIIKARGSRNGEIMLTLGESLSAFITFLEGII